MKIKVCTFLAFLTLFSCKTIDTQSNITATTECTFDGRMCDPLVKGIETNYTKFHSQLTGKTKNEWQRSGYRQSSAKIKLIKHNSESWYARWKMIKEAKNTIDLTYFIVEKDVYGKALIGALHEKLIRDGIKLRIMLDARGTKALARTWLGKDLIQELHEAAEKYNSMAKAKGLPQTASVEIKTYNPFYNTLSHAFEQFLVELDPSFKQLAYKIIASNHDKILLVDGEKFITGGRNISINYFASDIDHPTGYADTDVLIEAKDIGQAVSKAFESEFKLSDNHTIVEHFLSNFFPKVKDLRTAYVAMDSRLMGTTPPQSDDLRMISSSDWKQELDKNLNELKQFKELECHIQNRRKVFDGVNKNSQKICFKDYKYFAGFAYGSNQFTVWDKTSILAGVNDLTKNVIRMIDATEKEIILQNPYVIFTEEIWSSLLRACNRNVSIILHTNSPKSTDSILTQAWFLKEWKFKLAENKCLRILAFEGKQKLHSKVFVFDRTVAAIGSYNLDPLAQNVNSEILLAVQDEQFATNVALQIIFDDILDPNAFTREYLIVRDPITKKPLIQNGEPVAAPGDNPERLLQNLPKEKVYRLLEYITNYEYLRDFS